MNTSTTCLSASYLPTLMTYMTSLISEHSDTLPPVHLHSGDHFDFIVVGAGSAGCVVANRLSEITGWSVLLLEAGGEEPATTQVPAFLPYSFGSPIDWGYRTEKQTKSCGGHECYWPRGKVLGGTSALNAMIYNRGNSHDYDHWAEQGNTGWSYKDVLPYFKKSENNMDPDIANNTKYHSTGGYLSVQRYPYLEKNAKAIHEAFRELGYNGIDFNTETHTGVMFAQATQENGERRSTNKAFIEPIRHKRANLKVVPNVRVTKILIHPENKTAYGVEYANEIDRSETGRVFASKEIVLSAGAVNSPQLLMLSGIGLKETLEPLGIHVIQELNVGRNLQDHFSAPGVFFTLNEKARALPSNEEILIDSVKYSKAKRDGPWATVAASGTCAKVSTRYANHSIDNPDFQLIFTTHSSCAETKMPICYYDEINFHSTLLRPKSRGYVTINTTDPFVQPLIYPNYFTAPEDVDATLESYNIAIQLGNTKALKDAGFVLNASFVPTKEDFESGNNPLWEPYAWYSFHHQSGTCKMGPSSDSAAVVDPQLKVHGIHGLRVADASIMPFVTSGNTNAPCIMIGEKVSDMIKNSWDH
ncbi:glucose dehydrogenase [FAD, quinone]-like [Periplaneta americana]|uniref:glucose dehydrogenase [FAD, quinone]-like n=1 Tax=Periplaneta americana TaxID=6978 RepID=UPI0037E83286